MTYFITYVDRNYFLKGGDKVRISVSQQRVLFWMFSILNKQVIQLYQCHPNTLINQQYGAPTVYSTVLEIWEKKLIANDHTAVLFRLLFWFGIPKQMSGNGGSIHSDSGRWQHHRIRHQCAHDGIQKLITGICIGLLFLLLEVC